MDTIYWIYVYPFLFELIWVKIKYFIYFHLINFGQINVKLDPSACPPKSTNLFSNNLTSTQKVSYN